MKKLMLLVLALSFNGCAPIKKNPSQLDLFGLSKKERFGKSAQHMDEDLKEKLLEVTDRMIRETPDRSKEKIAKGKDIFSIGKFSEYPGRNTSIDDKRVTHYELADQLGVLIAADFAEAALKTFFETEKERKKIEPFLSELVLPLKTYWYQSEAEATIFILENYLTRIKLAKDLDRYSSYLLEHLGRRGTLFYRALVWQAARMSPETVTDEGYMRYRKVSKLMSGFG